MSAALELARREQLLGGGGLPGAPDGREVDGGEVRRPRSG